MGCIPDDHELMAGMVGLQTAHRYGNATLLASDMVFGIGNRFANRHTGSVEKYTEGRKIVHIDIEPTQIGRVLCPDLGIVSDAKAALTLLVEVAQEMQKPVVCRVVKSGSPTASSANALCCAKPTSTTCR